MNERTTRIAVLGGGVAGVVAANELGRSGGFTVDLIERESRLGGLQRSVRIEDIVYDIGAFVFDREHQILKTFPGLLSSCVQVAHSNRALRESGRIDHYPLSMRGFIADNGAASVVRAALDLAYCKIRHRRRDDLISYIKYYIGGTVYRGSGLRDYIERLYRTSDRTIDLEFGRQRLQGIERDCSLRANGGKILAQLFTRRSEPAPWICYVRPRGGFDEAYGIIAAQLRSHDVAIRTGTEIAGIGRSGNGFTVETVEGGTEHYDRIISTIPIATASDYIGRPLDRPLEYMDLISLFYRFRGEPGYDSSYLYNFTSSGEWKRISTFSRYYGLHEGEHYFAVECTVRQGSDYSIEEQRREFERHIARYPIFHGELSYQGGVVTPNAYPFFRRGDTERIGRARRALTEFGIEPVGRQGSFAYTTSHETARNAEATARNVGRGREDGG